MKNFNDSYKKLPQIIRYWMMNHGAWLVGSGVDWYLAGGPDPRPKDLDIMIPPQHWQACCQMVPSPIIFNTFGGLKSQIEKFEVDFWPMHLEEFLAGTPKDRTHKAFRLKPYTLVIEDSRSYFGSDLPTPYFNRSPP